MEIVLSHHLTIAAILAQLPTVAERARLAVVCRAWAVAVRRSPEIWHDLSPLRRGARMYRLCAEGNFAELKRSAALLDAPRCLASFEYACVEGRLDIAEWLVDRYGFGVADLTWTDDPLKVPLLAEVCGTKRLDTIQWFIRTFRPPKGQLLHSECLSGPVDDVEEIHRDGLEDYIPALDWVVQHYNLTPDDLKFWAHSAFYRMCETGHLDMGHRLELLHWLTDLGLIPDDFDVCDMMEHASTYGETEIIQFLYTEFNVDSELMETCYAMPFRLACAHGHIETAQWLAARFDLAREHVVRNKGHIWSAMAYACRSGRSRTAQWLALHYKVTSEDLLADKHCDDMLHALAVGEGGLLGLCMMQWLITNFDLSSKLPVVEATARRWRNVQLVKWLKTRKA
jgi:hypothetical protein